MRPGARSHAQPATPNARAPSPGAAPARHRRRPICTLRIARQDDTCAIATIVADAFAGREVEIGRAPEPLSLDVPDALDNGLVILAEDGRPLGCAVLRFDEPGCDLEVLAVVRAAHGRGVGTTLLERAELEAAQRGARTMRLYTSARLPQNHAFYRARGFEEAGRTGTGAFERTHFAKALPPAAVRRAPVEALYGRRRVHGHGIHPAYARLAISLDGSPAAALPDGPLRVEVGFGGGEHLLHEARGAPGCIHLGIEPFETGMMRTAARVEAEGLTNVRLFMGDARMVLDWLDKGAVERVDVLYPDPWPKQKHWKRRFISMPVLTRLARVLAQDGTVRFASDIPAYVDWTRDHVARHGALTIVEDQAEPWQGWPGTRYEAKALREGRRPRYLTIARASSVESAAESS